MVILILLARHAGDPRDMFRGTARSANITMSVPRTTRALYAMRRHQIARNVGMHYVMNAREDFPTAAAQCAALKLTWEQMRKVMKEVTRV
jgi:hypothetical protein